MFHRKVTSSRSITLPKALVVQTGINVNTPVDIYSDGGKIVIEKHVPTCRFCGDKLHAKKYKDIEVCPDCAKEISEEVTA